MLKLAIMTRREAKIRAEKAAQKIMDMLIPKLIEFRDKNHYRNNYIEQTFGFPGSHIQKIMDKERSYQKPELITVLQLIYGIGLTHKELNEIFEEIGLKHHKPNIIELPESFSRLKERERHLLLRIIDDFVTSHTLPDRHIKTAEHLGK